MTQFAHRVVLFFLASLVLLAVLPLVGHLTQAETGVALAVPLDTETPTATPSTTALDHATPTETPTATTVAASVTPTETPTATALAASVTPTQTPTVTVTVTPTATLNYPLYLPHIARMPDGSPGAPTLSVSRVNTTVTATWSAAPNARAYTLWLATGPSLADARIIYNGDQQSYTITLDPGVYYFIVQARNAWGAAPSNLAPIQLNGVIGGRVTQGGLPAADVLLLLRFYDGENFSTIATTRTDSNGNYAFVNLPSLAPEQEYYVRYDNPERNPARLSRWNSFRISDYPAGFVISGGNFDIQNVTLIAPASDITTKLPTTFSWAIRNIPGDTYSFTLFDPNDANALFDSGNLGVAGSYTLQGLPVPFAFGKPYGWSVRVYNNPQDEFNYGSAFYYHSITFRR